ncbi:MAG TPA: hypothetical protein VFU55_00785 [Terracidiphilus sp.]|nr:hypothetical protein [Terracidiphilus sp.]
MRHRIVRRSLTLFALAMALASIAPAQSSTSTVSIGQTTIHSWQYVQTLGSSKHRLVVVTFDQPHRRQACRVKSFTKDELVCKRAFGKSRVYRPQQVLALILPGDGGSRIPLLILGNAEMGAAIWGTVVLAATCPACAAATAFAALYCFVGDIFVLGDDQPDRLVYLAQGNKLTGKLAYVKP